MTLDINYPLKIYLGAIDNGGYEPIHRDERMRRAFPDDHARMMELIVPYLAEGHEPDWTRGDLIQEAARFEAALRRRFPELDAIAARALSNRSAFNWK